MPDKAGTLGPSNCTPGEEAELEYPNLTKRLEMLQFLHRALEEHQNRGDVGLVLEFYNPPLMRAWAPTILSLATMLRRA